MPCPNCSASFAFEPAPRYCPACGQPADLQPAAWRARARESAIRWWRSLVLIATRPGGLTREHMAGRRARYVPPLRLYLVASAIFFLVGRLADPNAEVRVVVVGPGGAASAPSGVWVKRDERRDKVVAQIRSCEQRPGACSWFETANLRLGKMAIDQAERPREMSERFWRLAPNAVFLLLPAFAALVMLAYRSRRLPYGTHFVFSLHVHSAAFLALALLDLLPRAAFEVGSLLVPLGYAAWAQQVAYRGRWWATLLRMILIVLCYALALMLVVTGLGIVTVLTG